jgi:2-polyprenyl-6-methoxyphenol hydroxylase-like FAD-dependent oxidoreductase
VPHTLIVGAGIAGLSLAIALRRRGIEAEIIERSPDGLAEGAGLYLVGNATRALRALGLGERVILAGRRVYTQGVFSHTGTQLATADVEAFWKRCGPCIGLRRSHLHSALSGEAAGLRIRFGVTVQSLQQQADHVTAQCSDGSTSKYELVVGADGIRSSVRSLEFGTSPPSFRGQVGWRFIAQLPDGIEGWSAFLGRGCTFLFVPVGEHEAYCYADQNVPTPIQDPADQRLRRLRTLFDDFAPPVRATLARMRDSDPIHFAPIEEVIAPVIGRGRVVLIGDAAHAMSPSMANGAAMAFEDALVLADLLAREGRVPAAVEEFARRRAPRIEWVRSQTNRRDRMRRLPPALRNTVLRLLWSLIYAGNYRPLLGPL